MQHSFYCRKENLWGKGRPALRGQLTQTDTALQLCRILLRLRFSILLLHFCIFWYYLLCCPTVSGKKHQFRFGKFGLRKKVSISLSENLVSKKSHVIGFGQNFGIVIQWIPLYTWRNISWVLFDAPCCVLLGKLSPRNGNHLTSLLFSSCFCLSSSLCPFLL